TTSVHRIQALYPHYPYTTLFRSQTITVPGVTHPLIQTYSYDALNRLESATETQNLSQTWAQKFTFDRYGNRNFDVPNTTTLGSRSEEHTSELQSREKREGRILHE